MFAIRLKQLREDASLPQRKLAAILDIDTATYSKIENGLFTLKKEHISVLEKFYGLEKDSLAKLWLADKVYNVIKDEPVAKDALNEVKKIL